MFSCVPLGQVAEPLCGSSAGRGWSWPCPRRGRWAGYMNSPAISDWGPQYLSADGMAASLLGLWAAGVSPSRGRGGSPSGWGGRGGPGAVWAGAREARAVRGGGGGRSVGLAGRPRLMRRGGSWGWIWKGENLVIRGWGSRSPSVNWGSAKEKREGGEVESGHI